MRLDQIRNEGATTRTAAQWRTSLVLWKKTRNVLDTYHTAAVAFLEVNSLR
jgi:hypothetical protein